MDYHKTFENYRKVKLSFLESCKIIADWQKIKNYQFATKLLGQFNRQNCLAAIAVAKALEIEDKIIKKAMASFKPLPGRLEMVVKKPFLVIVDFAHTSQAFEKVLPEVKKLGKKLVHVFGCTGDRDKNKRPIMGQIAAKYDDIIILTHEDTYSENPEEIINQIEKGVTYKGETLKGLTLLKCFDRREAIKKALELAKPGDVVFISGVGHQKSLNLSGREVPWSDQKVVKELLDEKK
ncbi:hypothetical protein HY085_00110 [Candidatus Gottesmanbacteria bacterium]|nr:hypothetical protein [Candidatus Gottesmanbacteria bacterium]